MLILSMLLVALLFADCVGGQANSPTPTTAPTPIVAPTASPTSIPTSPPAPTASPTPTPPLPTQTPTTTPIPSGEAQTTLENFMLARIYRDYQVVRELLSDALRQAVLAGSINVPVFQVSNPCWYRYDVVTFRQQTSTTAAARVRVYQHFWGGDNAGGPPNSWKQEMELVESSAGWRVDKLGPLQNQREEPKEPHGPTTSACNVARQAKD